MDVNLALLLVAAIIAIGFFANWIFIKTKVSDLIWLLLFGLLLGPIFGLFDPDTMALIAPFFSAVALLIILFDAGLNMKIYKLLQEVPASLTLALTAFVLSVFIVAIPSFYLLNLSFPLSLLLGVIIGGSSSAIVIPIVSRVKIVREPPSLILGLESVISDALCIVVALVLMEMMPITGLPLMGLSATAKAVVASFSIAIVLGFVFGVLWSMALRKLHKYHYYYMLTLAFLFCLYPVVELLGGNGPIACLTFGLVLGNARTIAKGLRIKRGVSGLERETLDFNAHVSFFVRVFFFVFLGTLVTLSNIWLLLYGAILAILLFGVRALAVKISTSKLKLTKIERKIMCCMLPRGLAAAVLVSMPYLKYGIAGAQIFTDIVFSVIISTAIISTVGIFVFTHPKEEA